MPRKGLAESWNDNGHNEWSRGLLYVHNFPRTSCSSRYYQRYTISWRGFGDQSSWRYCKGSHKWVSQLVLTNALMDLFLHLWDVRWYSRFQQHRSKNGSALQLHMWLIDWIDVGSSSLRHSFIHLKTVPLSIAKQVIWIEHTTCKENQEMT